MEKSDIDAIVRHKESLEGYKSNYEVVTAYSETDPAANVLIKVSLENKTLDGTTNDELEE